MKAFVILLGIAACGSSDLGPGGGGGDAGPATTAATAAPPRSAATST